MYSCLLLRWRCVPAFLSLRRGVFPELGVASCKFSRQWSTAFPLQRAFWTTPRRPSSESSGASSASSTGTISSELPSRRRLPTGITLRLFVLYGSSVFSNGSLCCTNRQLCWAKRPAARLKNGIRFHFRQAESSTTRASSTLHASEGKQFQFVSGGGSKEEHERVSAKWL